MEIKVDGRLLVSTLCKRFKDEFGGTLRVYQGQKRLTGDEKVSEVATKTGSYECRGSKTVGGFEKDMMTNFGLKVQVRQRVVFTRYNGDPENLMAIAYGYTVQDYYNSFSEYNN